MMRPSLMASIGRTASTMASSTRLASSINKAETEA
jgi:hypothetical protein